MSVGTSCGYPHPSPSARPNSPHEFAPHVNNSPLAVRHTLPLVNAKRYCKLDKNAQPVARACRDGHDVFLLQVWDALKKHPVRARLDSQLSLSVATAAEYGARR